MWAPHCLQGERFFASVGSLVFLNYYPFRVILFSFLVLKEKVGVLDRNLFLEWNVFLLLLDYWYC